jgi:glucose-6-phosphate isomerase
MSQRSRTRQKRLEERNSGAKKGFGESSKQQQQHPTTSTTNMKTQPLSNPQWPNNSQHYTLDEIDGKPIIELLKEQDEKSNPQYKVTIPEDWNMNNADIADVESEPHIQHNVFETWITRARQDISHVATQAQGFAPPQNKLVSTSPEWKRLERHATEIVQKTHLRNLLKDEVRCDALVAEHDGVYLDYSRQQVTLETMELLKELAEKQNLEERIDDMMSGEKINFTEDRAVLHTALRADKSEIGSIIVDGVDAVGEVHEVLAQIKTFTDKMRSGELRGYTGKRMRNVVSVGIGGSYLGPEFLHECLKTDAEGVNSSLGYTLRFLANIDPVDVERACADLDPEETLILVVSKTFTTAETMLNARTMRQWLWDFMGNDREVVKKHFVACASISSVDKVKDFGIDTDNYFFRFWDWVGGRYSVCSAVGAVPISLQYGFDIFEKFLEGAKSIDEHFRTAPFEKNIPILMGMTGVWNMSFLGYKGRALLPYAEALLKLPAHVQQLDMEVSTNVMWR